MTTPVSVTPPIIVSAMVQGISMTVQPGTYTGGPVVALTYVWKDAGVAISGATTASYTGTSSNTQHSITCEETASDGTNTVTTASAAVICYPPSLGSTTSNYTAALAAVADNSYFSHTCTDTLRIRLYQRQSGVGVQQGVTAANGGTNFVTAAVRAVGPVAGSPILDFDSMEFFYAETQLQSRIAGAPAATLNLLGMLAYTPGQFNFQGTVTVTPRYADSVGGTNAFRLQYASGAAAATDIFWSLKLPPGTWTFSFDAQAITTGSGAAAQTLKFGMNGTTSMSTAAVTTTLTKFTATMNVTVETALNMLICQGSNPSAAVAAGDVMLQNIQVTPGTAAQVPTFADLHPHPAVYLPGTFLAMNGYEMESLTLGAANGNTLVAKQSTLSTISAYSYMGVIRGDAAGGTPIGLASSASTSAQYLSTQNTPAPYINNPVTKLTGQFERGTTFATAGRITWGAVSTSTGVKIYFNGDLIDINLNVTTTAAVTNLAALSLHGLMSPSGSQNASSSIVGDVSGAVAYPISKTDAEMKALHTVLAARATAKSLPLTPLLNVLCGMGDSQTYGFQATLTNGYLIDASWRDENATARLPHIQVNMQAIVGEHLSQLLTAQLGQTLAMLNIWTAAGIRPIVSILIGTNDASNLTTQAQCDTYYTTGSGFTWSGGTLSGTGGLKEVYAILRANGAKLIVCTLIANGVTAAYDSTSLTIGTTATATAAGLVSGTVYTGPRYYLNDLIRLTPSTYDSLCDFANDSHLTGIYSVANANGVMFDTLHWNDTGYGYARQVYSRAASTLLAGATYAVSATEAGSAADSTLSTATDFGIITEAGAAADSVVNFAVFAAVLAQALAATDVPSATFVTSSSMLEAGIASDAGAAGNATAVTITESGTVSDSEIIQRLVGVAITEVGNTVDGTGAITAFLVNCIESGTAIDLVNASSVLSAALLELGVATELSNSLIVFDLDMQETGDLSDIELCTQFAYTLLRVFKFTS